MGFALSDLELTSPAFADGGPIPAAHSADGGNVSPPLAWARVPEGTRSLAVVCFDPDAPLLKPDGTIGVVHWVLYDIPAGTGGLAEGTTEFTAGPSDRGEPGYYGPQPPPGHGPHRYVFWLLALRREPDLPAGLDLRSLLSSVEPDVLGMNRLVGTFENGAS